MNMQASIDILDLVHEYKAKGEAFALATVVRTVSVTAAKAGAKAIIMADGAITGGWIGGGCARGAVLQAAKEALADGKPRLISVQPDDLLYEQNLSPGELKHGVLYARNMCPSQGTVDVFVEPMLPRPQLTICGSSPVAVALADLASRMGFFINICAPKNEHLAFGKADRLIDGFDVPFDSVADGYLVVSTQGRGDTQALRSVIGAPAKYLAFVGSLKKFAALKSDLLEQGVPESAFNFICVPAGLDIGAVTPDEIAFSIVAQMIEIRRRDQFKALKKG
jgi:xanthine dehydrogenase accessory factor